jgi:hypothetical protein
MIATRFYPARHQYNHLGGRVRVRVSVGEGSLVGSCTCARALIGPGMGFRHTRVPLGRCRSRATFTLVLLYGGGGDAHWGKHVPHRSHMEVLTIE